MNTFYRPIARLGGSVAGLSVLVIMLLMALTPADLRAQSANGTVDPRYGPRPVADLAEGLFDAVVNISTSQNIGRSRGVPAPQVPEGSPFKDFFDEFFDEDRPGRSRRVQSLGSGFIIEASGLIVTNNHVIADADEITAILADGTELVAEVVGRDAKTDLAVLKVTPKTPLKAVEFGDSDALRVGDWVMAIGNPFGLGGSLTVGVVSARNRNINAGPYDNFIQTDAAINRGNSGGPLFDMQGKVVGINTAIFSPSGVSVGIGFAVPAAIARRVVDQLVKYGETRRGWLGVRIQDVTEEIAESLGLDMARGALVAGVAEGGPADEAGLVAGDVITRFDGQDVAEMRDLPRIVADTEPGRGVEVEIVRDGEVMSLEVTVRQLEEEAADRPKGDKDQAKPPSDTVLGLKLAPLDDDMRDAYGIDADIEGVVVIEVEADSAAADKGITEGTVIVEVAQNEVRDPIDVINRVEDLKSQGRRSVLLLLSNGTGELRFVAIRVEGEE